jgi:hypothetical protein
VRKKLLACCVAVIAFAAAAGPASASASEVVLKAGGTALKPGDELFLQSENVIVYTGFGEFPCSGWLKAEVTKNPPAAFEVSEDWFYESGGYEERHYCGRTGGRFAPSLAFTGPMTFIPSGEELFTGSGTATLTWAECKSTVTVNVIGYSGDTNLHLDAEGIAPSCLAYIDLKGDFWTWTKGKGETVTFNVV